MIKKCATHKPQKRKALIKSSFFRIEAKSPLIFPFILGIICLLQSCSEPSTGCRDISATNYNVTADEDCEDDCCEYPSLKVQFAQRILQNTEDSTITTNFAYNTIYTLPNNPQDSFIIQRIKAYFADFQLIDMSENTANITDQITVDLMDTEPASATVTDDIILFDASNSSAYTLGTFREPGTYQGLKFRIGLQEDILTADPDNAPINELRIQSDSLNYIPDVGYIAQRYLYFPDPLAVDSTVVTIFDPVEIELITLPFAIVDGFDATLHLTVNYDKLFENISFPTSSAADFQSNIVINLPNAITLDSLEQN